MNVLALDYDGTIAEHGTVERSTWSALSEYREGGGRLILVTGRVRRELEEVCARLDLFERVVAENGGTMFVPGEREEVVLCEEVPIAAVERLRAERVEPLSIGRAVIATLVSREARVRNVLGALGVEREFIRNKNSLMLLPKGVTKATGLGFVLKELGVDWRDVAGAGDAENDLDFLRLCGCAVAVSNALPEVKAIAGIQTRGACGAGIVEFLASARK